MGCYAVNMSRILFAAEPSRVFATQWTRPGEKVDTTTSGILDFGAGRTSIFSTSFDFINPRAQVEVVGADGWLSMQGTGMRGEPFTRLLHHRFGDEVFLGGVEPIVESFSRGGVPRDEPRNSRGPPAVWAGGRAEERPSDSRSVRSRRNRDGD